ncbi:MAG: hypothetical protein JRJ73_00725 [Deltaproteobacteria bacterium]|nr:hypothetical protein [Deltaproteobacteria bacterium]
MTGLDHLRNRLGLLVHIVEKYQGGSLGRTVAMKLFFLLQTVKKVPLGYNFRLYTYGPFDSEVLNDLDYAVTLGGLESQVVYYPSGYGYKIDLGEKAEEMKQNAKDFLKQYNEEIDWVLDKFGQYSATDLELISTISYVNRNLAERGQKTDINELSQRVSTIKPRFSIEKIKEKAESLNSLKLAC